MILRKLAIGMTLVLVMAALPSTAAAAPRVTGNFLVDLDHGLQFSKNKQNECCLRRHPRRASAGGRRSTPIPT